jgi:hypothetical protein
VIIAYGVSFIGAYLLALGIAAYAGGFNATKWSIYAYACLVIVAGGVRGHFIFEETVKNISSRSSDAMDEPEAYGVHDEDN